MDVLDWEVERALWNFAFGRGSMVIEVYGFCSLLHDLYQVNCLMKEGIDGAGLRVTTNNSLWSPFIIVMWG